VIRLRNRSPSLNLSLSRVGKTGVPFQTEKKEKDQANEKDPEPPAPMRRRLPLVLLLALAGAASAAPFLPPNAIDVRALLQDPPAAGSQLERAELDVLLQLQAVRTPAQAARCVEIEHETLFGFGADVVGPWFTAANLPRTAALFAAVREEFIPHNRAAKALWSRRRPPFVEPRLRPCVELSDSGAYPSGHGIQSALWAALLADLMPAHADGFAARAAETRWHKLLSGVHYPSDLTAGRLLGEALAQALRQSPAGRAALAEARAEIAACPR